MEQPKNVQRRKFTAKDILQVVKIGLRGNLHFADKVAERLSHHSRSRQEIHNSIKDVLASEPSQQETEFIGQLYSKAIIAADDLHLEDLRACLTDLVESALKLGRLKQNYDAGHITSRILILVRGILDTATFSSYLMNSVVHGVIWKYLDDENGLWCTNAAEMFLKCYPLRKPPTVRATSEMYLYRQHDAISDFLTSPWHLVRHVSIYEVCRILKEHWETVPMDWREQYMKSILMLSRDSVTKIRSRVYSSLGFLASQPLAHELLRRFSPTLRDNYVDPDSNVRDALASFLTTVYQANSFPYWEVISIDGLIHWLQIEDSPAVAKKLVNLLFRSFCCTTEPKEVFSTRLFTLILMSPNASRNLFYHSEKELTLEGVIHLISLIQEVLSTDLETAEPTVTVASPSGLERGKKVTKPDGNRSTSLRSRRSSCRIRKVATRSSCRTSRSCRSSVGKDGKPEEQNDDEEELNESVDVREVAAKSRPSNLTIAPRLLDIMSILLTVHAKALQRSNRFPALKNTLKETLAVCTQHFVIQASVGPQAKQADVVHSLLHFASLVDPPEENASDHVLAVLSLKSLAISTASWTQKELLSYLNLLLSWRLGDSVLGLVMTSLTRQLQARTTQRSRGPKVPRAAQALRLIDIIFSTGDLLPPKLLDANKVALLNLWTKMKVIKTLAEHRVSSGNRLPKVQDLLLFRAFALYGQLTVLVAHMDENLNAAKDLSKPKALLNWANRTLVPHMESVAGDIERNRIPSVACFLHVIQRVVVSLIRIGVWDDGFLKTSIDFGSKLLDSEGSPLFQSGCCEVLRGCLEKWQAHHGPPDHQGLFRTCIMPQVTRLMELIPQHQAKHGRAICKLKVNHRPSKKDTVCFALQVNAFHLMVSKMLETTKIFFAGDNNIECRNFEASVTRLQEARNMAAPKCIIYLV